MVEELIEKNQSGILLKHKPDFIRWKTASLREAGKDSDGYYLKIDGLNENGETEQLYVMFLGMDVVDVILQWKKIVEEQGGDYEKWKLRQKC